MNNQVGEGDVQRVEQRLDQAARAVGSAVSARDAAREQERACQAQGVMYQGSNALAYEQNVAGALGQLEQARTEAKTLLDRIRSAIRACNQDAGDLAGLGQGLLPSADYRRWVADARQADLDDLVTLRAWEVRVLEALRKAEGSVGPGAAPAASWGPGPSARPTPAPGPYLSSPPAYGSGSRVSYSSRVPVDRQMQATPYARGRSHGGGLPHLPAGRALGGLPFAGSDAMQPVRFSDPLPWSEGGSADPRPGGLEEATMEALTEEVTERLRGCFTGFRTYQGYGYGGTYGGW